MEVLEEALCTPWVNLPVQRCCGALLQPPPHVLAISQLCSVEHVLALKPLQATDIIKLPLRIVDKASAPEVYLPSPLDAPCGPMHSWPTSFPSLCNTCWGYPKRSSSMCGCSGHKDGFGHAGTSATDRGHLTAGFRSGKPPCDTGPPSMLHTACSSCSNGCNNINNRRGADWVASISDSRGSRGRRKRHKHRRHDRRSSCVWAGLHRFERGKAWMQRPWFQPWRLKLRLPATGAAGATKLPLQVADREAPLELDGLFPTKRRGSRP
mmetsp:Transcript_93823/g.264942  ORF Transcript_93823/g.264942 Transcript_93823/m.264942 type:complete len:266 (-) Transcript_93823:745-1542(-)